jgi:hypothetical protein
LYRENEKITQTWGGKMSKKCPRCGRETKEILKRYENGSIVYQCKYKYCNKAFVVNPFFFDITKSAEVLAEKLVYCEEPERFCENASWCSLLLGKVSYAKKAEAIAATLAKLNEVID